MVLRAEFREDQSGINSSSSETRTALPSADVVIKKLFFPESEVEVTPVNPWSPNVLAVKVGGQEGSEYIAKSYPVGSKDLLLLESMREWAAKVLPASPIAVPQYVPSQSGEYFPTVESQDQTRICLMEKLPLAHFEVADMSDFQRMGVALGMLHKLAPILADKLPIFQFSYTNAEVESYWHYLDKDEEAIFRRVLAANLDGFEQVVQPTHNDLHPANILISRGKLAFIDFDQMQVGPRANDFGQLLSSFWLNNTGESFDESIKHFISGYQTVNKTERAEIASIPLFALRKIFISFAWFKGLMYVRNDRQAADFYLLLKRRAEILFQHALAHDLI